MVVAAQRGIIQNLEIVGIEGARGSSANASFNLQGSNAKYIIRYLPIYCADYLDDTILDGDEVVVSYNPKNSGYAEQLEPFPIILMRNLRSNGNFGQGALLPAIFSIPIPLILIAAMMKLYFSDMTGSVPIAAYFVTFFIALGFFVVPMLIAVERIRAERMMKSIFSK